MLLSLLARTLVPARTHARALRPGLSGLLGAAVVLLCCQPGASAQLSTEDHVAEPGFWPTKSQDTPEQFAGKQSCAHCHGGIAHSAALSSMGRTATQAGSAGVLRDHPRLEFHYADDLFQIQTQPGVPDAVSTYSVSDGKEKQAASPLWIFGTGRVGQSYLFKKDDGHFYEARVTFFRSLNNLGFTPARGLTQPADLATAMGRRVDQAELIRCFSCHATAVSLHDSFNEAGLQGGVTCEACHGPGAAHVATMSHGAGSPSADRNLAIFAPSHLSPTESVEFCGACHGSWWDVKLAHVAGPSTVRSAPYRLVTSKCWGTAGDPRLVCTACHDPHRELVTDLASYDAACLRCHAGAAAASPSRAALHTVSATAISPPAPACPVAKSKCAGCHMPQVYVPEMKNTFTDHRIRIVKDGEAFQD